MTICPWVENPGPVPPEIEQRAQAAFAASSLPGSLRLTGEGEYTCTEFHLRSVGFEFTLDVSDLHDLDAMRKLAARVKDFPVRDVLNGGNLDAVRIRFRHGKDFCWWDGVQGCGPVMPLANP